MAESRCKRCPPTIRHLKAWTQRILEFHSPSILAESATTCLAAQRLGRQFIDIDFSRKCCEDACRPLLAKAFY